MEDNVIELNYNSKRLELLPKQTQTQGNNDYNTQVHLIQSKLLKMGFNISMVNKVIYHFKISSTEEGVYYLVKTDGMWNHSFIPQLKAKEQEMSEKIVSSAISTVREKTNQELCDICGELKALHRSNESSTQKKNTFSNAVRPREMDMIDLSAQEHNQQNDNDGYKEVIQLDKSAALNKSKIISMAIDSDREKDNVNRTKTIKTESETNCGICLSEYDNPVQIKPCNHMFCKECFSNYLTDKIYNNNVDNINCPTSKCLNQLQEDSFLKYIPDEYLLKYYAFKKKNEIAKDPLKIFCPLCDSYGVMSRDENQTDKYGIRCTNNHSFCCCGRTEHDGECYKEGEETIEFIRNESIKKCPKCGFLIKKDSGCNHMTCGNPSCQYEFCWLCMRESLPDHYKYGECKGMQFIDENSFLFRLRSRPLLFMCINKILNFFSCLLFFSLLTLFLLIPMLSFGIITYIFFVSNNQMVDMFQIRVNGNKKAYAFIFWLTITLTSVTFLPFYYLGLSLVLAMLPMLIVRKIIFALIRKMCSCVFANGRINNSDGGNIITETRNNDIDNEVNASLTIRNDEQGVTANDNINTV